MNKMIERENFTEDPKFMFAVRMAGMQDIKYAPVISEWTQKAGTMLPKSPEEIIELFLQNRSAVVVNAMEDVVSHAAAAFIYTDGSVEFGALVTGGDFQGKGAATMATEFLLGVLGDRYPNKTIFALANPMSAKLFQKIGAGVMDYSLVTDEVWKNCANCPNNPSGNPDVFIGCCDTPYDLTDIALNSHHS
ncbi:MAG: hypothetical protein HYT09_02330 [Candidatus Levybacteria bacterium]|nr:hypothetical protein [Candidatus Levybacteria bacterium]